VTQLLDESLLDLGELGLGQRAAGEQENIPSRLDEREQGVESLPQEAFSPVAGYGSPDGTPGRDGKTGCFQLILRNHKHNKRVGIRLSYSPHPLEIGRSGQAELAFHSFVLAALPGWEVALTTHQWLFQLMCLTW
jgi:hypothetical protein